MKRLVTLIISIVMGISLVGCNSSKEDGSQSNDNDKITVYTTIFPIYDFTMNIGKDKINLNYVVPPGGEPHEWEPSPKLIGKVLSSNVFIYNGLGIDNWAENMIDSSENKKLVIVKATDNIDPIKYNKDDHEDGEEEDLGQYDPHIWLNPEYAIKACENIKNGLIKADPNNKDYYEKNYNDYIKEINSLDSDYKENLKNLKTDTAVVSHGAYEYLCKAYNLKQKSITGLSPNQEPSPAKLSELTKYAKENNTKYIFFDGLVNPKTAQTLANEVGIQTATLYSIDGISKKDFENGESYISLMKKNLDVLTKALK